MVDKRAKFRVGLHPLYLPFYDALCAELGPEWQPYCGLRGPVDQAAARASGASLAGPWESPHNYGCASDWCLWDGTGQKPTWPVKGDARWKPYIDACDKVGAQAGAHFNSITDYPHNEYKISVSWGKVRDDYVTNGLDSAMQFIQQMHV